MKKFLFNCARISGVFIFISFIAPVFTGGAEEFYTYFSDTNYLHTKDVEEETNVDPSDETYGKRVRYYHRNEEVSQGAGYGRLYRKEVMKDEESAPPAARRVMNFDGVDDYINVADNDSLDIGLSDFSIVAWIKLDRVDRFMTIVNKNGYKAIGPSYHLGVDDYGKIHFTMSNGVQEINSYAMAGRDTLQADTWYQIALTLDRDGMARVYINGTEDYSVDISGVAGDISSTSALNIGKRSAGSKLFFDGSIDGVKIYNSSLSAGDVADLNNGQDVTDNLAASWDFDEGAGTSVGDSTDNNNHGQVLGNPVWPPKPVVTTRDRILNFDGTDDYVTVADSTSLDIGTSDFTITAWIKLDRTDKFMTIVNKNGYKAIGPSYHLGVDDYGKIHFTVSNGVTEINSYGMAGRDTLEADRWYLLALVLDRDGMARVYVDGAEDYSVNMAGISGDISSASVFNIGKRAAGSALYFDGSMDDVMVYNRALKNTEITDMYTGVITSDTGQVSWWDFDEGAGSIAGDSTDNDNNGQIKGNPVWPVRPEASREKFLNFDGIDSYINFTDNDNLDMGTSDVTITAWIKLDQANKFATIINKNGYMAIGGASYHFGVDDYGKLHFTLSNGVQEINTYGMAGRDLITADTWHHVAVVLDRDGLARVYLDGAEDYSVDISGLAGEINSTSDLTIGRRAKGSAMYFNGGIDDVIIYGRALKGSEITDIYTGISITSGQAASWNFDEGTGSYAHDSSANDITGELRGGPVWLNRERVLSLDGTNDYVSVADNAALDIGISDLSISVWVKLDEAKKFGAIVNKNGYNAVGPSYHLGIDDYGKVQFTLGDGNQEINSYGAAGRDTLTAGAWYHIVLVLDRDGMATVYLNGAEDYSVSIAGLAAADISSASALNIGKRTAGTGMYFDGGMDDLAIYKKVLSSAEVSSLYSGGSVLTGRVAAWDFDEGYGKTAVDSQGLNDGIINGASWIERESDVDWYWEYSYVEPDNPYDGRVESKSKWSTTAIMERYDYFQDANNRLKRAYKPLEDNGAEWENTADHYMVTAAAYDTRVLESGVYTADNSYQTYEWTHAPGQVRVEVYDGEYLVPDSTVPVWADVVQEELRLGYVYDHHNEYSNLDPSTNLWTMRVKELYDANGEEMIELYEWYASGSRMKRAYKAFDETGAEWEDTANHYQILAASYTSTVIETGLYEPDNSYQTYDWTYDTGQVEVEIYAGEYTVEPGSPVLGDVIDSEFRVSYVYDHHGNYNTDQSGWVLRQKGLYSTDGSTLIEGYRWNGDVNHRLYQQLDGPGEDDKAYQYYDKGQGVGGDPAYYVERIWDSNSIIGYSDTDSGLKIMQWAQGDYDDNGNIDTMFSYELYKEEEFAEYVGYNWVNQYDWSGEAWGYVRSYNGPAFSGESDGFLWGAYWYNDTYVVGDNRLDTYYAVSGMSEGKMEYVFQEAKQVKQVRIYFYDRPEGGLPGGYFFSYYNGVDWIMPLEWDSIGESQEYGTWHTFTLPEAVTAEKIRFTRPVAIGSIGICEWEAYSDDGSVKITPEVLDRSLTKEDVHPADIPEKPAVNESGPSALDMPYVNLTSEDLLISENTKLFFDKAGELGSRASGEGVLVSILDSGINSGNFNIIGGYDFAGDSRSDGLSDADYSDPLGHGTETARVFSSVAAGADIFAAKVLDNYGKTASEIVSSAIKNCVDAGSRVLLMPFELLPAGGAVDRAIDYAVSKGAVLIAAAGNDSKEIKKDSLAGHENVISVGSRDNDGKISAWSNYGDELDLFAPWDVIGNDEGTSFSAAFVAGIAALMISENPDITADEILEGLKAMTAMLAGDKKEEDGKSAEIKGADAAEVLSMKNVLDSKASAVNVYGLKEKEGADIYAR
ncbi:MAG: LamG-like jellyroll fold domain-containing protein [Candidatus Omnitrophota bacterium]